MGAAQDGERILVKNVEKLIRKHDVLNKVVGRSVTKLVKFVATRCVGMAICNSRSIEKHRLSEMSAKDYFSKDLRSNWKVCSRRGSRSGVDIGGGECGAAVEH